MPSGGRAESLQNTYRSTDNSSDMYGAAVQRFAILVLLFGGFHHIQGAIQNTSGGLAGSGGAYMFSHYLSE